MTAESCTGGGLAYFITKNPECSPILERGFVAYSNQSKECLLEVSTESLQLYGAVSKEVVQEMAEGALKNSLAQIAIATSGIASEDCTAADKNKGKLWLACAGINKKTMTKMINISGTREDFVQTAIIEGLKFLHNSIKKFT